MLGSAGWFAEKYTFLHNRIIKNNWIWRALASHFGRLAALNLIFGY
jgi:hypothetical protein